MLTDMRLPLARFRNVPRLLYGIDDFYLSVEALNFSEIASIRMSRLHRGLFNVFIISKNSGCMRLKSLHDSSRVASLLADCRNKLC